MSPNLLVNGTIINPSSDQKSIDIIEDGFIVVIDSKIVHVGKNDELDELTASLPPLIPINLNKNQFVIPGLIDTHIHAPQYPNVGLGYDKPLLEWLVKYTYKVEAQFTDLDLSKRVYNAITGMSVRSGTTTACYFGSMYADSCMVLAKSAIRNGQRAFIGKVNMTRMAPDDYIETPEESIRQTLRFIEATLEIGKEHRGLIQPIITPRFAPSLEMDVMQELGQIAQEFDLNIQTHISENKEEVALVKKLFDTDSYAAVYDAAGLLTPKTVLAHGIYLTDDEMKLLARRGASVSHCPNSNSKLKSGICNLRKLQDNGVNIALGTDVAAGASASIIDAMRCAIDASFSLTHLTENGTPINCYEAFYMATLGGAKALAIEDKVGTLAKGKYFDAVIIDMDAENSSSDLLGDYTPDELFQKFIYIGDDRNVKEVYVAGTQCK